MRLSDNLDHADFHRDMLPPILAGQFPSVTKHRVEGFYSSIVEMFEGWIARRQSPNTQDVAEYCETENAIDPCTRGFASYMYPLQLNLQEFGKVTSHLVKYSWHPDGRAHFSQDGKVKTEIKRNACPIRDHEGHVFTIQAQTLDGFQLIPDSSKAKPSDLRIQIAGEPVKVLRIVGYRYSVDELNRRSGGLPIPDFANVAREEGIRPSFFIGPPAAIDPETVLLLVLDQSDWLTADHKPVLMFIGGLILLPLASITLGTSDFLH